MICWMNWMNWMNWRIWAKTPDKAGCVCQDDVASVYRRSVDVHRAHWRQWFPVRQSLLLHFADRLQVSVRLPTSIFVSRERNLISTNETLGVRTNEHPIEYKRLNVLFYPNVWMPYFQNYYIINCALLNANVWTTSSYFIQKSGCPILS